MRCPRTTVALMLLVLLSMPLLAPGVGAAATITATAGTGGTISPSGAVPVSSGGSQTFTFTPNALDVVVDGHSLGATGGFGPRSDFDIGTSALSLVMADLNRDGKLDVAAANEFTNTVTVLLGDGLGGFAPPVAFTTGEFPTSIAVADLNGDGKLDLVVADGGNHPSGGNTVSVMLGDGAGGFGSRTAYPTGTFPIWVAVGDLNEDGKPDLVVADVHQDLTDPGDGYGALSVLLGDGLGGFGARTDYPDHGPNSLQLADVNGDGHLDAVTSCGVCQTANVLLGDGAGHFGAESRFVVGGELLGSEPSFVGVADLNGDGFPDLVASNWRENSLSVLLGDGSGSYPTHTDYPTPAQPRDLAIVDVSGDGKLDVVVGAEHPATTVSVLYGDGAGGFLGRNDFSTPFFPLSVAIGDLNGDGKPDLASSNFFGDVGATLSVRLGGGMGSFTFQNVTTDHTIAASFTHPNTAPVVSITGIAPGTVVAVGTPVTFTGAFTDDAGDTHTAQWRFDTISQAGVVDETNHTVSATHTFTAAGVYSVALAVTDQDGASGTATTLDGLDALVVVYDPSAGFVTGAGWINSPAGAYVSDPSLTGKANFGFQARYQKGATVPSGQTEFQFRVASLAFQSTNYDWLVVAGARAQYKGSGTINGTGDFAFMLTAIDGDLLGGGSPDKFRIRIWDKVSGAPVYDNQLGVPDDSDPTTALGGGTILIQTSGKANGGPPVAILAPGVPAPEALPARFALHPCSPSPMARSTLIPFDLASRSTVKLAVYDAAGREVVTLADGVMEAGRNSQAWDGRDRSGARVGPGLYFIRLDARGSRGEVGFAARAKLVIVN